MRLGDSPIASLTEQTKRAILCANLYPVARQDMLRAHPWNCCVRRVLLAPLVGAPPYEWGHWFAKPGDWIRTLDVGTDGGMPYVFENNRFLANATSLPLRYVADVSEGNWDANMVAAMVARMERDLAYPITKSTSLMESKEQAYKLALRRAKTIDGQENPPEEMGDSPFIDVRSGSHWVGY